MHRYVRGASTCTCKCKSKKKAHISAQNHEEFSTSLNDFDLTIIFLSHLLILYKF